MQTYDLNLSKILIYPKYTLSQIFTYVLHLN